MDKLDFQGPIGVFDSGFGGLTILRDLRRHLPQYDYIYLGDNARAPYGVRSFDLIYSFTLQAVKWLFRQGCPLVILACNTASAKALRSIQQNDLPAIDPTRRVLGVIRPTVESIGHLSRNRSVALLGTPGTVSSRSYDLEVAKLYPGMRFVSKACPMFVPLVENNEIDTPATDYFVDRYLTEMLAEGTQPDTVLLGCTHYPMLYDKIARRLGSEVNVVCQGDIVARSLVDYFKRHPEMESRCTRGGECAFYTTENADKFGILAEIFLKKSVKANHVELS